MFSPANDLQNIQYSQSLYLAELIMAEDITELCKKMIKVCRDFRKGLISSDTFTGFLIIFVGIMRIKD
jgi:hypothetical protein